MHRPTSLSRSSVGAFLLLAAGLTGGCSTEVDSGSVPEVETSSIAPRTSVTHPTLGLTITAITPETQGSDDIRGGFTVSGTGSTAMGVCMLNLYLGTNDVGKQCSTASDCADVLPDSLFATGGAYANGSRYCVGENNASFKYCHFRPGSQADFCAGTPVLGTTIGPGTYMTPYQPFTRGDMMGTPPAIGASGWLSYACFAGCASIPGSLSMWTWQGPGATSF